jgi:hypothetical protein
MAVDVFFDPEPCPLNPVLFYQLALWLLRKRRERSSRSRADTNIPASNEKVNER